MKSPGMLPIRSGSMSGEPKSSRRSPISSGRLSRKPRSRPTRAAAGMSCGKFEASRDRLVLEKDLDASRIKSVVVGTPGVVNPATGGLSLIPNISGLSDHQRHTMLAEHFGQEVASKTTSISPCSGKPGRAAPEAARTSAFLALGTGVGLGLIINGKLVRGAAGAAGEIAYLPIGARPDFVGRPRLSAPSSSR